MSQEDRKQILSDIRRSYERATSVYDENEYISWLNNLVLLLSELTLKEHGEIE